MQDTIATEKAIQLNYSYADIRKWLLRFRTLDYSKAKNRKDLIDTFIYKVILYDNKMKILFHLKGGQQSELLLNLIFPDYSDGHGDDENAHKLPENEKETDKSVSLSSGCAYTPVMIDVTDLDSTSQHSRGRVICRYSSDTRAHTRRSRRSPPTRCPNKGDGFPPAPTSGRCNTRSTFCAFCPSP